MQSEEQSELRRYLHLTKACRDIATKIHPYYEKMYPGGVGQMTALDPELSNAPLAMKIEFCELHLETLRELQRHVSATGATVSSSAASKDNTIMRRHQPVGRPPRSQASSAMYSAACSSNATYTAASCRISKRMEATFNGETNYRSATILGILLQRNVATATSVAPKRAFGRFSCT